MSFRPTDPIQKPIDYLDSVIIGDYLVRKIIFLSCYSCKVPNVPNINVYIRGNTSSGKSHISNRIIELIGGDDFMTSAHMTQKSLYYWPDTYKEVQLVTGEKCLVETDGNNIDWYKNGKSKIALAENMENVKSVYKVVELTGKTILFTDKLQDETLLELKPILSADTYEMAVYTVQRSGSQNKTEKIIVRGQPTLIFCQALASDQSTLREITSRAINISVDESQEKIKQVVKMKSNKVISPLYKNRLDPTEVQEDIQRIFNREKEQYCLSPIFQDLAERLYKKQGGSWNIFLTDMRYFDDYLRLIQLHTLYNSDNRPVIRITPRTAEGNEIQQKSKFFVVSNGNDYVFLREVILKFSNVIRSGLPETAQRLLEEVFMKKTTVEFTHLCNRCETYLFESKCDCEVDEDAAQTKIGDEQAEKVRELDSPRPLRDMITLPLDSKEIEKLYRYVFGVEKSKHNIQVHELDHLIKGGFIEVVEDKDDRRKKLYDINVLESELMDKKSGLMDVNGGLVNDFLEEFVSKTHNLTGSQGKCNVAEDACNCGVHFQIGIHYDSSREIGLDEFKSHLIFKDGVS